jgi:hypothetical protein
VEKRISAEKGEREKHSTYATESRLTSSGFNTPGGLATTSVNVVNVPPGNVVTITVVNSGGTVRWVDPDASVVVNVTGSDKVIIGVAVGEPSLCLGTLATGFPEPFVVVGGFGDPVVESPGRSADEGLVEVPVDEEPPPGEVEIDESLVDGGVEVVVGVVLITSVLPPPPPEGDVEIEVEVEVSLVDVEVVEVSVVLVLSCVPLLDEEVVGGGGGGGGLTEDDDMVEVEEDELEGDDGGVSVTVGPLESDVS